MNTYRCAVIGNPIAHSQSPALHEQFAREAGISLIYDKILSPLEDFETIVRDFFAKSPDTLPIHCGLNITLPFKVRAYQLAEQHTDHAQHAGAVNTFYLNAKHQLVGDNTDGIGLCRALMQHGYSLKNKRMLLLGAGGAARGALYPLLQAGVRELSLSNRTLSKAQQLIKPYQSQFPITLLTPEDFSTSAPFDFIINATSAGLHDETFTLPTPLIHRQTYCYDMVYGKPTAFLRWAAQHHLPHHDGYSMLVAQARESFARWFGSSSF